MDKLTLDLSGCYYKDILVGDLLYAIGDDRFYKITRTEWTESWIIIHSGEFSYAGDIDETLPKTEFRLYRNRYTEPFDLNLFQQTLNKLRLIFYNNKLERN